MVQAGTHKAKISPIGKAFGAAVADVRDRLDLTQQNVADRVGYPRSQIAMIERGWFPPMDVALRLAKAFKIDLGSLVAGLLAHPPGEPTTHLRHVIGQWSPGTRQQVISALRALAEDMEKQ